MNGAPNWQLNYPAIVATLGIDWINRRAGQLSDTELMRQELHSMNVWKSQQHDAECEAAAMAIVNERAVLAKVQS